MAKKPKLKKYTLSCGVKKASGHQTYTVMASSEKEAITKHNNGESEFKEEEISVDGLGEPKIIDIEDV